MYTSLAITRQACDCEHAYLADSPTPPPGFTPNVMRNAIVNVAETVCYDITKDTLLYYNLLQNGIPLHFSAAAAAGQSLGATGHPGQICYSIIISPNTSSRRIKFFFAIRLPSTYTAQ